MLKAPIFVYPVFTASGNRGLSYEDISGSEVQNTTALANNE